MRIKSCYAAEGVRSDHSRRWSPTYKYPYLAKRAQTKMKKTGEFIYVNVWVINGVPWSKWHDEYLLFR